MGKHLWITLAASALMAVLPAQADPLSGDALAVHVLNRIAFGPKPGDIERVRQMGVQAYIDSQLNPASIAYPPALTEQLRVLVTANRSSGDSLSEFVELRKEAKEEGAKGKQERTAGVARIGLEAAQARVLRAVDSPRQLEEVMVDFWYNHFNVFSGKGIDRALVASYERDAIRPYVFGSFRQMLGATAHHPAMLYYLDNHLSTADGFVPAPRRKVTLQPRPEKERARGLNENYARELMELHTLGVDGGYTQADVTELARMLTGWTYDQRELLRENRGFHFDADRHDRGTKVWLGQQVKPNGQAEGEWALDVLAMHPATAHHLAYKLAQYFVQDVPPPALVDRLARTYLDNKGEIRPVLRALFASDEFLSPQSAGAKFKTPYQFVISAARAGAVPLTNVTPLLGAMSQLGMPLYGCQTPDGYKNTQEAWLNPDALSRRIGFANALAGGRLPLANGPEMGGKGVRIAQGKAEPAPQNGTPLDAAQLQATLGSTISSRTASTVAASPAPLRAAMLLGSPDFMQH